MDDPSAYIFSMNSRRWLVPLGAVSLVVLVASAAGAANLRLFDRVNRADHSTDSPLGRERFDVLDPVTSTDTTAPRVVVTSTSAPAEAPAVTTVTTTEPSVTTADNEPAASTVPEGVDGTGDTDGTVPADVQDTSVSAPRTTKPRPRPQPPTVPPVNSTPGATAPTPQPTAPPPDDTTVAPGPTRSTPPTTEHRRGGRGSGSGSTSTSTTDPGPDD